MLNIVFFWLAGARVNSSLVCCK